MRSHLVAHSRRRTFLGGVLPSLLALAFVVLALTPAGVRATPPDAASASSRVCLPLALKAYRPVDGNKIVFASNRDRPDGNELYWMNPDGSNVSRLFLQGAWPDWSLDHKHIAWAGAVTGAINVRDVDTWDARQVTQGANDIQPAWSPDGNKIAYVTYSSNDWEIRVINADGSNPQVIVRSGGCGSPDWSPDGSRLVFHWNNTIYYLYLFDPLTWYFVADGLWPAWSPDGSKIAYYGWSDGQPINSGDIYWQEVNGEGRGRLTTADGYDGWPAWSPDGSKIVYYVSRSAGVGGIYVMNADGSDQYSITTHSGDWVPSWH